ncbi:MAG: hypothetical protein JST22_18830 [Bacteroidetes bacterium]|nr:hypothetical protein [Bacteroidota bacterium]
MSRSRRPLRLRSRAGTIVPAALIAALVIVAVISACAPLYTPNVMHSSLPDRAGTVQGGLYYGASSFNATAEVAPIDGWSLLGSFAYDGGWFSSGTGSRNVSLRFAEGGIGKSLRFGSAKMDILAGYGAGHAVALWPLDSTAGAGFYPDLNGTYRVEGNYRRAFVQVNAVRFSEQARESGLGLRTSYVWFTDLARTERSTLYPRAIFLDPVAFIRGGSRNIQFELQGGFSAKLPLNSDQLRVQVIFIELGVHGVLEGLW